MREYLRKAIETSVETDKILNQNKIQAIKLMINSEGWKVIKEDLERNLERLDIALKSTYPNQSNLEEYQKWFNDYWAYKTLLEYPERVIELLEPTQQMPIEV